MKYLIYLLIPMVLACTREVELSEIPSIELEAAGPSTVVALQDSLYFELSYSDGDGDLGENSPDVKNLFLRDERIDLIYRFRIRSLVPDEASVPIRGTLYFSLPNTIITNGAGSEDVQYSIWVEDRAGNKSNTVTTPVITVVDS